jgi:hypothetical protein
MGLACPCSGAGMSSLLSYLKVDPGEVMSVRALLKAMEFGACTRLGYACPNCRGLKISAWPDEEQGPDRGHEPGCLLRAMLDLEESG